jgi:hypothetical protein
MPTGNKRLIHDRILTMRFMPGEPYSLEQMARAVQDLWPGAEANHVRGVVAGLASTEALIRKQMVERGIARDAARAKRTPALESG